MEQAMQENALTVQDGQEVVVHMQNIGFSYTQSRLFNHLDLEIKRGNIYGLLGKNGAGKTTLLKILSGQLFIEEGETKVLGENPQERKPSLLSEIFYLPEEFPLPKMKASEYLAMRSPFYPKFDHEMFSQYCREFDIDLNQRLDQMSLGQKKKVLLSFGLATNTALLILDEPTNGLDIPSKRQFRQTVASAMTEQRTFIISTHQVRDMENLIDPIIILHDGKVIFNDTVESVNEKYVLSLTTEQPKAGEGMYTEKVLGGWMVLSERTDDREGKPLDLETLFNVIIEQSKGSAGGVR
ncbi:ATP-binding cassette domain-containing protein [Sphaerochaeta sp. S2]|uniref:ABC transporter ATP-binding protein n=1 Tax=Sphaerochaeta sp. S2 TaxID=2798868 RepID=UPI001E2AA839|nr:ABC transporter ATP-binding protein [Sphaerochaeta sp. S2]MCK9349411.1 ABC transporter ATP-binding protein [Sphaerochaeta sp.]MDD4302155.1 ABC transporter ATP-binding protein [Sphaerochaeta sp.]